MWSEWEIRGSTVGGDRYLTRGVAILSLRGEEIASVGFYIDNVDPDTPSA